MAKTKEISSGIQRVSFKSDGCWRWTEPCRQPLSAVGCLNSPAEQGSVEQMVGSVKQPEMVDSLVSTIGSESRCLPTTFAAQRK